MVQCEEDSCKNFQSGICLHCNRRLCVYHIVDHQKVLSNKVDELKNQINQINIDLVNASKTAVEKSKADVKKCVTWRTQKLREIDREYSKMINPIRNQQIKLEQMELKLKQRLKMEVQQPLELMSTQENVNPQLLDTLQLTIQTIKKDTQLIIWNSQP